MKSWRHSGSVAYSRDRHDSAVASVASTWVAVDRIFSARGSRAESAGGVIGGANTWSENVDFGGDGFWGGSRCSVWNWPAGGEGEGEGGAREAAAAAAAAAVAMVETVVVVVEVEVRAGACCDIIEEGGEV